MKYGLPPIPDDATLGPQHNGSWYDEKMPGQGALVHIEDGFGAVYFFTFDLSGQPRWYFGFFNCPENSLITEFDLQTTYGGRFDRPGYKENNAGTAQLYFLPDGTGVLRFKTEEHVRHSIALNKSEITTDPMSGVYDVDGMPGQGKVIMFFVIDGVEVCVVWWFTYDNEGNQRWYICVGANPEDDSYRLTIFQHLDGKFLYPIPTEELSVGDMLLSTDDGVVTIVYNLDAVGVRGDGAYAMKNFREAFIK